MSWQAEQAEVLADVTTEIRFEASGFRDLRHYLQNVGKEYASHAWWGDNMTTFFHGIETIDSCNIADPTNPVQKNILYGTLLGMRVTQIATNLQFLEGISIKLVDLKANVSYDPSMDARDRQHQLLQYFKDKSQNAVDAGDPNAALVADWVPELDRDITTQPYIGDAFGLVLFAGQSLKQLYKTQSIYGLIEQINRQEADWDSCLAELEIAE